MHPIPCSHCGYNFMRQTLDPEVPTLCNNCSLKEELRNPKKEKRMETVDILIKCQKQVQNEIEEICINRGVSFTKYFLDLHESSKDMIFSTSQMILPREDNGVILEAPSKKAKVNKK